MQVQLIIEDEEGATTVVSLGPDEVTIGREEGNTIRLTEQNVSRKHARLWPEPDGWMIEDLGSYNGIRINGAPIQGRVLIVEGDLVQIGDYHLALSEDVDKATLNVDRSNAANDDEPLLASSSAALPRIEPGDSGATKPNGRVEAVVASGVVAAEMTDEPGIERLVVERRSGRAGPIVVFAGIVIALGLVGALYMNRDEPATEVDAGSKTPETEVATVQTPPVPAVVPFKETPSVVSGSGTGDVGDPATEDPATDESATEEPATEEPATEEPKPKRRKKKSKDKRSRPKKKPKSADPGVGPGVKPPPPPSDPDVDPKQLLQEARKASLMGNATQAYKLAKQSYDAKRSQAALEVMGVAACKMGDAVKAKAAYNKLGSARQKSLAKVCSGRGITL